MKNKGIEFSALFAATLAASGCSLVAEDSTLTRVSSGKDQCAALLNVDGSAVGEKSLRVLTAAYNPASEPMAPPAGAPPWVRGVPALPAHCEILGVLRERTGSDGQEYAVNFHLRMPEDWNGRFLFQGGGGTNGIVGDATGTVQAGTPEGVNRGFAVISTDTGHDNKKNSNFMRQGQVAFAHDYEARLEYAEKALDTVATVGKNLVAAYYKTEASYNYFAGCSNGGREGMVFAQRFPEHFDGIVATAPAFAVPKAALAEANDTKAFAALAETMGLQKDGLPDISMTYSQGDLQLVSAAVLERCDAADGLKDGLVQDFKACTTERVLPALNAKLCTGEKAEGCLIQPQIDALVQSLAGPKNSKGEALYASWPWDPGLAAMGWRVWKIGIPNAMPAINVTLGSPALSGLFVTPPDHVNASPAAGLAYQRAFDFDTDAEKLFATTEAFPRSSWDLVGAQSTDLSAFADKGGKMIVPHGSADPIFSLKDTVAWWEEVNAENKGAASDFVRVFNVPGMNHCVEGPSANVFDALIAVVNWVEEGTAPDVMTAKAGPATPFPGIERPLCPYPTLARYKGGPEDKASSFTCEE